MAVASHFLRGYKHCYYRTASSYSHWEEQNGSNSARTFWFRTIILVHL